MGRIVRQHRAQVPAINPCAAMATGEVLELINRRAAVWAAAHVLDAADLK